MNKPYPPVWDAKQEDLCTSENHVTPTSVNTAWPRSKRAGTSGEVGLPPSIMRKTARDPRRGLPRDRAPGQRRGRARVHQRGNRRTPGQGEMLAKGRSPVGPRESREEGPRQGKDQSSRPEPL